MIYENENDNEIKIPDSGSVHKVYVEIKNKHSSMKLASEDKMIIKMQINFLMMILLAFGLEQLYNTFRILKGDYS